MGMTNSADTLIDRIARYCEANSIAETTFGLRAVNDGKLVSRLKDGRDIQLKTLTAIEGVLAPDEKAAAK